MMCFSEIDHKAYYLSVIRKVVSLPKFSFRGKEPLDKHSVVSGRGYNIDSFSHPTSPAWFNLQG